MNRERSLGVIDLVWTLTLASVIFPAYCLADSADRTVMPKCEPQLEQNILVSPIDGIAIPICEPRLEQNIPFRVIPEPELGFTIDYALDRAIHDADRWAVFWNEIHPGDPVPPIDFGKEMVVATALGGGTATSSIEVTGVTKSTAGLIKVYIKETRPGRNCIIPMIYAPPPHVLVVTEAGEHVTFRRNSVYRNCP